MRGRNRNSKGPNPLTRSYESNGPDVKIRGTAQHVAEKYSQLARDSQASGDPVAAENYFQHAEHYFRILNAMNQAQSGGHHQQHQRRFQTPSEPAGNEELEGAGDQPETQGQGDGAQQGHAAQGNGHQPNGRHANGHAPEQDADGEGPPAENREPA
jgi:uncharacterized protein DUF4167